MNDVMQVLAGARPGYVLVRPNGRLSSRSVDAVYQTMVGLLNLVSCVVADLSALELSRPELVLVFPAALADGGGWPRARLGLYGADPELLGQLRSQGVCAAVAVADKLDAVLEAINRRPLQAWAYPSSHAEAASPVGVPFEETLDNLTNAYQLLPSAGNDADLALFVWEKLGSLLDYHHRGGFDLASTLSVFLDHGGDHATAAGDLGIHRSTLRYHLHRVREISGHDLREAATRRELHVATSAWSSLYGRPELASGPKH
jgi:hypothetical protein